MRPLALVFAALAAVVAPHASAATWQPTPEHTQVSIWPGEPPDAVALSGPETTTTRPAVGGRPWLSVERVSQPTMTVYPPKGHNTGAAVVVFPGGGYWVQDAQRTLGLVRQHAAQWQIDPHKIGVLGFSAGGHLVAAISTHFERRLYPAVDAADAQSCRPDFAVALYPGHLWIDDDKFELNPDVPVSKHTPPTFLLQAQDDHVDGINQALVYYIALKDAGVPAEMHLYPDGGHAFGLRPTKFAITRWPALVDTWLHTIGMTPD